MDNNFVDEITKKIVDKIGVTGRYKDVFSGMDKMDSSSKTLVRFCEILLNKIWKENERDMVETYKNVLDETDGNRTIIDDDYVGRNQIFEETGGKEQSLYKIIAPLLGIVKNFNDQMPEEMKMILLTDCFNTIAHNMELIFGSKQGSQFWFELKNRVLEEMLKIFDKDSVYINIDSESGIASIFFKADINGEIDFFSWHSKEEFLKNIEGFRLEDYQNSELYEQIQNKGKTKSYNHQTYNYIFQHCVDYEKSIEDVMSVEKREPKTTLAYEGGGSYEDKEEIADKLKKLVEDLQNVDSQEEMELLIKNSDYADKIQDVKILKLRGRYPVYYAELHINGKTALINCKKGFECKKHEDKCYTKDDIGQIETSTVEEISGMLEAEQLIKAKDIDQYIKKHPEKFAKIINGMTVEQKTIIMRAILCSSSEKDVGHILKELFAGENKDQDDKRNGGFDHE